MSSSTTRRELLRQFGIGTAALPFVSGMNSLRAAAPGTKKQRLVVMFSANGVVPWNFWPDEKGEDFTLKESLQPLEPFRERLLIAKGICNKIRGAGSAHMNGIGGLLTGVELSPGNLKGGSGPSAGWANGISIDQEIAQFLQSNPETETRFGSLEFGVDVPDRADVWTRMSYRAANQPATPISDPYQMFRKLYGQQKDQQAAVGVLDVVREDLRRVKGHLSQQERRLLDQHATFVEEIQRDLQRAVADGAVGNKPPELDSGVSPDDIPRISQLQIDLLVQAFAADFNRVATLQYSRATSPQKLTWLGINESHHGLSHEPDDNQEVQEQLTRINHWFCEQLAYLVRRLQETPEPDGSGSLLDNTLVVWGNELGKGNSHTRNDLPFVMVGGCEGFRMGRSLRFNKANHNQFLMSLAHGFGHHLETFGDPNFCGDGPLTGLG